VNTYGPTETTVVATYAECHPERPISIGKPLRGYSAMILDEQLKPVPEGTPGELCVGGSGVARGYLGRPELTREKFIFLNPPDSLRDPIGNPVRFYRTGDLVRRTVDGDLEFLGRIDAQVKIRGFRVELGEIESALIEEAGVKAAAATLRED